MTDVDKKPPRSPRVRLLLLVLLAGLVGLVLGAAMSGPLRAAASAAVSLLDTQAPRDHDHAEASDTGYYTCGMHPQVILPEPGLCPICHMELTPLDPAQLTGEITLDPVTVQNIGVRIGPVVAGPVVQTLRTAATVTEDQTRRAAATTRIGGWIQTLHVAAEGDVVEPGDPLFDLYSPELYAAQAEYLMAYRSRTSPGGETMLESARTRLELFNISPQQIRELETTGQASQTLTLHSPAAGVVTELLVRAGDRLEPGAVTHRLTDLSQVWIVAALYEHQLQHVREGQTAVLTLPALPGRTFEGRIAYVYPWVDPASRQGRVRLTFDNDEALLRPGMYGQIEITIQGNPGAILAPREAVLHTGERQLVFVSLGQGRFEPREVTTGAPSEGGKIEVLSGLGVGEQVVISGQFLLDSESRMRSAIAKMVRGDLASDQPPVVPEAAAPHDAHSHHDHDPSGPGHGPAAPSPLTLDAADRAAVDRMVASYLAITEPLTRDQPAGADHYAALGSAAESVSHPLFAAVAAAAADPPPDAEGQRRHLDALSAAMIDLVRAAPPSTAAADMLYIAHCPMVPADWLQTQTQIVNPYMGTMMLRCGTIEAAITPRAQGDDLQGDDHD